MAADHHQPGPTTRSLYGYLLGRFLLPTFGEVPLACIDVMAVRTWLAELHDAGKVSATTIAKAYRLLGRILGGAVEAGYLPASPCVIKGAGVEHAPEMQVATPGQVRALADVVPPRYRAMILVAAYGGCGGASWSACGCATSTCCTAPSGSPSRPARSMAPSWSDRPRATLAAAP